MKKGIEKKILRPSLNEPRWVVLFWLHPACDFVTLFATARESRWFGNSVREYFQWSTLTSPGTQVAVK